MPAGDVAIKNVADLYLYPNTVRAVAITGAQVKEWLEMSAGIFNQVEPGKADQTLINPDFPSYNFDVIDGVTYRIDLSASRPKYDPKGAVLNAASNRIVDLMYRRQADRPGSRNSSSRPTTTGPAAAAISRRSTRRRSSSRRPTPTAT